MIDKLPAEVCGSIVAEAYGKHFAVRESPTKPIIHSTGPSIWGWRSNEGFTLTDEDVTKVDDWLKSNPRSATDDISFYICPTSIGVVTKICAGSLTYDFTAYDEW
jgi:hypothetical protein